MILYPVMIASLLLAADERPKSVKVAGIVLKWIKGDKEQNYQRAEKLIRQAADDGAKLVVTTESFLDGYSIRDKAMPWSDYHKLGEPIPDGKHVERLKKLADSLDIHLVAGMLEVDGDRLYNTSILIGPDGSLIGKYRKHRLDHELARNTSGDDYPAFDTPFGKLGMMICADRRYPETVVELKKSGADFIICPSGGTWGPKNNDPVLQQRSKEGKLPIVFVHPVEFLVTGPDGSILKRDFYGDNMDESAQSKDAKTGGVVRIFELPLK